MLGFATPVPLAAVSPQYKAVHAISTARRPLCAKGRVLMMADDTKNQNPLGGLGGIGNIMNAMKKAQEFSSSAKDLQEELKDTEIEATVRDGAVKVVMTGQQKPVEVTVSDELAKLGGAEVSKAVTECLIAAHTKSMDYMKGKMGTLTSSFGLPTPPE